MADQWAVKKVYEEPAKILMEYDSNKRAFSQWQPKIKDETEPINYERMGYQMLGGMAGGALAPPSPVTTPIGIGLGSAAGGQVYDIKEQIAGRQKPKPLIESMKTAGIDFALDVVSPIALSKGIYGAKKIGETMVSKPVSKLFTPAKMGEYRALGIKPTAGMVTQNKSMMIAENALSDYVFSSGVMQKNAQHNIEQLKFAAEYLAREYGPDLSKEEVGELLKIGSKKAMKHVDSIFERLFSRVSQQIGPHPQDVSNTMAMLTRLNDEALVGPATGIKSIAEDIVTKANEFGGLPFEALKKHRTYVGSLMKEPQLISTRNIQSGDLKRLYGALTQDMEQAALRAGIRPHASWRAANKYFETKLTRDIPILEEIVKQGYDEQAWTIALRASGLGGSSVTSGTGGSRLRLLRKQLPAEEWNAVAGTVLGKLGMSRPGAQSSTGELFSVSTFLTNWNKLSPGAKTALWGGTKYQALYKELESFAHVVGDMKSIEAIANKSKTASVMGFYSIFQALGGGASGYAAGGLQGVIPGMAVSAASMVGAPYATAKLLTNPGFVNWLSRGVQIMKTSPNAMSVHLGRLFMLREKERYKDPVVVDAIDDIVKKIPLPYAPKVETLPPVAESVGAIYRDTDTGKYFKSDGKEWKETTDRVRLKPRAPILNFQGSDTIKK